MSDGFGGDVAGVSALAEPARLALYRYVVAQAEPVSREEAARACDLSVHSAKFHLDRLVDAGLLVVEFRRLSGRTGPGAGRPSKLYRRSDLEIWVSLPARRYDLAGEVLAGAVERSLRDGVALQDALDEAAEALGRRCAVESGRAPERSSTSPSPDEDGTVAVEVLATLGYEPRLTGTDIRLTNCPFDTLARTHDEVVCGLNVALVGGLLDGLGCAGLEAVLDPAPQGCCVSARRRG